MSTPRLHEQLTAKLRQHIQTDGQPGQPLESISALARRYRVSATSLRGALLTLAREGLVELRHGSGCYVLPPRAPKAGHQDRCVGVLINLDVTQPNISPYHLRVAQGIRRELRAQGLSSRLYLGFGQIGESFAECHAPDFLEDVAADRLSAVAAVATYPYGWWFETLKQRGVPVVAGGWPDAPYNIVADNTGAVREAVRYLATHGRERIAMLGSLNVGNPNEGSPAWFKAAMAEQGLAFHPEWLRGDLHPTQTAAGWEEFREIWSATGDKPNGLLVTDDALFRDAETAILELGIRVPEDLLVVSLANKDLTPRALFPVGLLELDPEEVSRRWAAMLATLLAGQTPVNSQETVPFQWRFVAPPIRRAAATEPAAGHSTQPTTVTDRPAATVE